MMDFYELAKKLNVRTHIILEWERRIIDTVKSGSVILRSHIENANIGDGILRSSAPLPLSYEHDIFEWIVKKDVLIRPDDSWVTIERWLFRKECVEVGDETIEYWLRVE